VQIEYSEALWIDERSIVSLEELAERSGLSESQLRELVDYGALAPVDPGAPQWTFQTQCIVAARIAYRLHHDFELPPEGLAVVMGLVERVQALEAELRDLRARSPRLR
jgi:hypothetical protein